MALFGRSAIGGGAGRAGTQFEVGGDRTLPAGANPAGMSGNTAVRHLFTADTDLPGLLVRHGNWEPSAGLGAHREARVSFWGAEVVALPEGDAIGDQGGGLLGGLDSFGHQRRSGLVGEGREAFHQYPLDGVGIASGNQGAVELDDVWPQADDVLQRGVAGANVVD